MSRIDRVFQHLKAGGETTCREIAKIVNVEYRHLLHICGIAANKGLLVKFTISGYDTTHRLIQIICFRLPHKDEIVCPVAPIKKQPKKITLEAYIETPTKIDLFPYHNPFCL